MIGLNLRYKDYYIKSIEETDVEALNEWLINNYKENDWVFSLDPQIFYRRFLEYYLANDEFFFQVCKGDDIIGILKGRIEYDNKKEIFIWLFVIAKEYRCRGIGSSILNYTVESICKSHNISNVKVGLEENNVRAINFWERQGFQTQKIIDDFFQCNGKDHESLRIMKKQFFK